MSTPSNKPVSMSRRLTLALVLTMTLVSVLVGSVFYMMTAAEMEKTFGVKVEHTLSYLDGTLAPLLWSYDHGMAAQVAQTVLRDDLIVGVTIWDDRKNVIFSARESSSSSDLTKSGPIRFQGKNVGELELTFSQATLANTLEQILLGTLFIWFLGVISISILTHYFIRKYFRGPLTSFIDLAESYRKHPASPLSHTISFLEFQPIEDVVKRLANDVFLQLRELDKHRKHLETEVTERTHDLQRARSEAEKAKDKAEAANQAKSVFLANMSHELRTPLNAVLGFSEMMARDPETSQKQHENLTIINRSGQHLLGLINDVLDMSKIEVGRVELEPETFELRRLLHDIGDMFRLRTEAKDLQFSLDLLPGLPQHVVLDMGKLRQILINLLGNAIKFTESGGVTLRVDAKVLSNGKWQLHFEIEDTGIGIPADKTEIIFEAFAQTGHSPAKQQGAGLGLAITRQFIQLMGGEITVESTLNKGSVFRFEIPAEAADVSELEQQIEDLSQRVVSLVAGEPEWRILIVEDVVDNRLLLRRLLEFVGFVVREAVNGEEGIQQFKDWHPHLIWMDMRMPVMDGYEATRRIRTLPGGNEVKILALTASVFKEEEPKILAAGCDAVLHKPYNESVIFTAMEKQLGVHYNYEETNELLNQASVSKLELDDLQDLSDEWLVKFLTLVRLGDINAMLVHTDALAAEHEAVKAKLNHCINEFQFQNLIAILEEKIGST